MVYLLRIGLIDLDNTGKFPNLALMKISAFHKAKGNKVEWYEPLSQEYDIVYVSKVFSWSKDYQEIINAKKIIYGGVGYDLENKLDDEIEHVYPDYSLYSYVKSTAYGFLSRGCPRECGFCNVSQHQGKTSRKVADLKEFWEGQKEIVLLDPNILACSDWKNLLQQLIDSKASIDFSQGLDIRLMTEEKAEYINQLKIKMLHFAWDQYDQKVLEKLKYFRPFLKFEDRKLSVYVLVNYNTTLDQDIERIMKLRKLGYSPYVTRYKSQNCKDKKLEVGNIYNKLARWVNNRFLWQTNGDFGKYLKNLKKN